MNPKPVDYKQIDARWKSLDYSASGEKTTIGASGCGPTSMAMVLATWADKSVTPVTECQWALRNGYKCPHSGTYYGYFVPAAKRFGLSCERLNAASIYGNASSSLHKTVRNALAKGHLIIACMGKGTWTSSGHYIVVYDVDTAKNIVYINDPASYKTARLQGNYQTFIKQVKYYWIIKKPSSVKTEETKEEKDMTDEQVRKIIQEELSSTSFSKTLAKTITEAIVAAQSPVYNTVADLPYGKDTVEKLVSKGFLNGDGHGLALDDTLLRSLVICDRAGAFDNADLKETATIMEE